MTNISSFLAWFRRTPKSRSVADRIDGRYEPAPDARPWVPSERPPVLPWETEESGADEPLPRPSEEADAGDSRPAVDTPIPIETWRSGPSRGSSQQMIDEMVLKGLASNTQRSYLQAVSQLARHYHRSPDRIPAWAARMIP